MRAVLVMVGDVLGKRGRISVTVEGAEKALQLDPSLPQAHLAMGLLATSALRCWRREAAL
jgi:hypothetical protein